MYNKVDPITSITQKVEQGAQLFGTIKKHLRSWQGHRSLRCAGSCFIVESYALVNE